MLRHVGAYVEVAAGPCPAEEGWYGRRFGGLAERRYGAVGTLSIDNAGTMLGMKRSFSVGGSLGGGTGNVVSIYDISTRVQPKVLSVDALHDYGEPIELVAVSKRPLSKFRAGPALRPRSP
jgi:hypothetical protein